jgi:mitochondrial fission protein ELM1
MEAQGIAVAEAVGLPFTLKRVCVKGAMRFLPARLQIYVPPARLLRSVQSNEPLQPPWPRLVISIGRRSVPIALAVKRMSGAFGLHIQNPKVPLSRAPTSSPRSGPCTVSRAAASRRRQSASCRASIPCPIPVSQCCSAARAQHCHEMWTHAPINDTEVVASSIRRALHLETKA